MNLPFIYKNSFIRFFFKLQFYKQRLGLKFAKNEANVKQHPEAELLLFTFFIHTIIQKYWGKF